MAETPRDKLNARQVTRKAIPVEKAEIHDTAYTADDDFLAEDLVVDSFLDKEGNTVYLPAIFRIMVCLDTAAVFKVVVDDGSSEVDMEMNGGAQLTAQSVYIFDVLVHGGDTINFEADQNVQIEKFIVHEVNWGT